ncbi:DUF1223 domain-containing protein [Roseibium sp.]|uniref:DUF1223 domain-containing protein n=1 Tax=Roseibium sp. TaxID=1936156 RepID=UPI003B524DB7
MAGSYTRVATQAIRAGIFVICGIISTGAFVDDATAEPRKVIELFTSQGCSSCPPADRLAEQLVKEDDSVLTLLMPVDYWDYLGWKDTLASPVHSQRQRAYAQRRGDRSVYTPQMVINGEEHVVGSRESHVRAALDRAAPLSTDVSLKISDMAVEARVGGALPKGAKMATVYFLRVRDEATVEIGRGENAGREIKYVNVVRDLVPMGMWSGGDETFRMAKSKLNLSDDARCIILVQVEGNDGPGRIIGAAAMDWKKGF